MSAHITFDAFTRMIIIITIAVLLCTVNLWYLTRRSRLEEEDRTSEGLIASWHKVAYGRKGIVATALNDLMASRSGTDDIIIRHREAGVVDDHLQIKVEMRDWTGAAGWSTR